MAVAWQLFPRSRRPIPEVSFVFDVFDRHHHEISSDLFELDSNRVLSVVSRSLIEGGFQIETGKTADSKIHVPVLFGQNGLIEKSFYADGFHPGAGVVLEVEAGRAFDNNQWLKDLFQACMMQDAHHLIIAVRNTYRKGKDFERIKVLIDTLYASQRLVLPLSTVSILGY